MIVDKKHYEDILESEWDGLQVVCMISFNNFVIKIFDDSDDYHLVFESSEEFTPEVSSNQILLVKKAVQSAQELRKRLG